MATPFIIEMMSVMFLIPTQEFGGTVMMTISLKLVICQKGFILERSTKKQKTKIKLCQSQQMYYYFLYQNNPSEKIQIYI